MSGQYIGHLSSRTRNAGYTLDSRLSDHQSRLRRGGEEKNFTVLACEWWSLLRCSEACYLLPLSWPDWLTSHPVGLTGTRFTGDFVEPGTSVEISDKPFFVRIEPFSLGHPARNLLTITPGYTCCWFLIFQDQAISNNSLQMLLQRDHKPTFLAIITTSLHFMDIFWPSTEINVTT